MGERMLGDGGILSARNDLGVLADLGCAKGDGGGMEAAGDLCGLWLSQEQKNVLLAVEG